MGEEKRKQRKYGRRSKKREWSLHKKALASLCCIMPTLDNCVENDRSIYDYKWAKISKVENEENRFFCDNFLKIGHKLIL